MSAATLPKMSPPPRGAPSLNGCSGAPGVTRSPLSMEQGDLPRSVNKQTAGGRGESERSKPQNRGPGAGLLRVHERAGFCAAVACGAMFRVHRRGRRGVQAPGALGKGQSRGQRGERAGGREPRERAQTQPRPPHGLVGVCRDEAGGGGGCRRRGPRSLAWGSVSAHSLRVWGRPAPP